MASIAASAFTNTADVGGVYNGACSDQQTLQAIRRRIQAQMNGLDDSAVKVRRRIRVLDWLVFKLEMDVQERPAALRASGNGEVTPNEHYRDQR